MTVSGAYVVRAQGDKRSRAKGYETFKWPSKPGQTKSVVSDIAWNLAPLYESRTFPPNAVYRHERVYLEKLRDVLGYTLTPFEGQLLETPPEPEPDGDLEGDDLQDDEDFAYDEEEDA